VSVTLCATSDVPEGEIHRVELAGGLAIAIYNVGGEYFATDDLCTHGDASLAEGEIEGGRIVCPFHLGTFDIRTGEPTSAPCSVPLRTYALTVENGEIRLAG
jgi:p-cumate 2,3-dioxygenase ferredoxin subunit